MNPGPVSRRPAFRPLSTPAKPLQRETEHLIKRQSLPAALKMWSRDFFPQLSTRAGRGSFGMEILWCNRPVNSNPQIRRLP